MNATWGPGLLVLAAGLLAGVLFVLFSRRGGQTPDTPEALEDYEQRYRSLLAQLKELIGEKHQLPPERFEAERSRLELAAAAALKARDRFAKGGAHEAEKAAARAAKLEQSQAAVPAGGMMSPGVRFALIGGGAVVFFVMVGVLLSQEAKPRQEDGSMTGGMPRELQPGPQQPPADPELFNAMARLNQNPDDLQAMGEAAHLLIVRDDYEHAATLTERALGIDPFRVETRVHKAVLKAVKGDSPGALADLLHLADTFPDSGEALLFAGAVAMQLGNKPVALESFERFWASAPASDRSPRLLEQIELLRREVGAKQ